MNKPLKTIEAEDHRLLDELDRGFDEVRRRAAEELVCAEGCSECCVGPIPITRLDAWRLERGMRSLWVERPAVATAIVADAHRALAVMKDGFPGEFESGRLAADEAALDRFLEKHRTLACPVLDKATGSCRLYAARPVSCRTYGPPLAFEGQPAPHCDLCFREAAAQTIESCRWSPDPAAREQRLLRRLGVAPGDDWETLIAHAVAGSSEMERPE